MEKQIKSFLSVIESGYSYGDTNDYGDNNGGGGGDGNGNGNGDGNGYGNGNGNGKGNGYGYGNGNGNGWGNGNGNGYGKGNGDGNGDGNGYGNGDGNGYGYGYGNGDGNGDGYGKDYLLKTYNGSKVYYVHGIPCVFRSVDKRQRYAKIDAIQTDSLQLIPLFLYRVGDFLAHGSTLKIARQEATNKFYAKQSAKQRIEDFLKAVSNKKKHPASFFYQWHGFLTGSCEYGRQRWVQENNIDLDKQMSLTEFISLTEGEYGGDVISQIKKANDARKSI